MRDHPVSVVTVMHSKVDLGLPLVNTGLTADEIVKLRMTVRGDMPAGIGKVQMKICKSLLSLLKA